MATGTGKTLEDQAWKAFTSLLSADFQAVIYKENRDDWRRAEIVVTTAQSLLSNNKYQRLFSPTDFDLVISGEARRSIGGHARAVFDYFIERFVRKLRGPQRQEQAGVIVTAPGEEAQVDYGSGRWYEMRRAASIDGLGC